MQMEKSVVLLVVAVLTILQVTTTTTTETSSEVQGTDNSLLVEGQTEVVSLPTISQNDDSKNAEEDDEDKITDAQKFQLKALIFIDKQDDFEETFFKKSCGADRHCYNLLTQGLECRNESCQCRLWKGIELKWNHGIGSCQPVKGHPCVTDAMCYNSECDLKSRLCSRGALFSFQRPSLIYLALYLCLLIGLRLI